MAVTLGTPASTTGFGSTATIAVDVGSSATRVIVGVLCTIKSFSTMTFNGVALVEVVSAEVNPGSNGQKVYIRVLVAPDSGSHDLVFTTSGDSDFIFSGIPLSGVNQATPSGDVDTVVGADPPVISDTVISAVGNLVIDGFITNTSGAPNEIAPDSGQTAFIELEGASQIGGVSRKSGAASVTMGWTGNISAGGNAYAMADFLAAEETTTQNRLVLLGVGY